MSLLTPVEPPAAPPPPPLSTPPPPAGTPPAGTPPTGIPPAGTPPPSNQPFYDGWIKDGGKLDKSVYSRLPDHLKPHAEAILGRYDTLEAMLGGLINANQALGKKGLEPLPPSATPEMKAERDALMRKINLVPEKPEGYGITKPKDWGDKPWDDQFATEAAKIMHQGNVPPDVAKKLLDLNLSRSSELIALQQAQRKAVDEQFTAAQKDLLYKQWPNEGDFQRNISKAQRMAMTLGLDPQSAHFNDASMVIAMANFANMVGEDKLVQGESTSALGTSFRAMALDIQQNESNPLYKAFRNQSDPQHGIAVQKVSEYNQKHHASMRK